MGYEGNTSYKAFLILAILHKIYLPTHTIMFTTSLVSLVYSYLAFKVLQALYRLTFHPLANFPGPKLAAAFCSYKVYFEVFIGGVWSDQISLIHEQYGPIVRISPN